MKKVKKKKSRPEKPDYFYCMSSVKKANTRFSRNIWFFIKQLLT